MTTNFLMMNTFRNKKVRILVNAFENPVHCSVIHLKKGPRRLVNGLMVTCSPMVEYASFNPLLVSAISAPCWRIRQWGSM
jgi:hypothetical protein